MLPEIGLLCVILALAAALMQSVSPLLARDAAFQRRAAYLQCACLAVALAVLAASRCASDFSVLNVAGHSSARLPLLYKLSGTWGNHEGSLLLFAAILSLYGAGLAWRAPKEPSAFHAHALAVHGALTGGILLMLLLTSNPFARLYPPAAGGAGLNPLLQDIGLAIHPPLLYLGYGGSSAAFALAVAALMGADHRRRFAVEARPWIMLCWSFLTAGIALGAWWAYRELGWGGWWFWDPVENASLMPWLACTALLHSNAVLEKRGMLQPWVLLLAILLFALCIIGTFLVRSGAVTSVHNFASDPRRGLFLLAYLVLGVGGALLLYARRAAPASLGGVARPTSREGLIVMQNVLLLGALGTVLLGTLYPMALEWAEGIRIGIGPEYYHRSFLPFMAMALLLAGAAPLLPWKSSQARHWKSAGKALAAGGGLAALALIMLRPPHLLLALLGFGLAASLAAGCVALLARRLRLFRVPPAESLRLAAALPARGWALLLSHLGFALLAASVTAGGLWREEAQSLLRRGEEMTVGGYRIGLEEIAVSEKENYRAVSAALTVRRAGFSTRLRPELRQFPLEGSGTTEAAVLSRTWHDIYAVIGDAEAGGRLPVRVYVMPWMRWLWLGFILIGAGGMLSLAGGRKERNDDPVL